MNDQRIPVDQALAKEIEIREKLNPNQYYDAKRPSIQAAREMGLSDAEIEKALNIKLRAEDRQEA